jgi:hypothetical protein
MMTTASGTMLVGDWRRRWGSKTDAHLWHATHGSRAGTALFADLRPICGKRIKRRDTVLAHKGRPCTDCLVAGITRRDYSNAD